MKVTSHFVISKEDILQDLSNFSVVLVEAFPVNAKTLNLRDFDLIVTLTDLLKLDE